MDGSNGNSHDASPSSSYGDAVSGDHAQHFPPRSGTHDPRGNPLDSKLLNSSISGSSGSSVQRPSLADRRRSSRTSTGPYALRPSASFSSSSEGESSHHSYSPENQLHYNHSKFDQYQYRPNTSGSGQGEYSAQIQNQSWLGVGGHYQPDAAYSHSRSSSFSSVASDLSTSSVESSWSETEYPSSSSFGHQPDSLNRGQYAFPPAPSAPSSNAQQQSGTLALPMLTSHTGMMHISPPPPSHQQDQSVLSQAAQRPRTAQTAIDPGLMAYADTLRAGAMSNSHAEKVKVAFVHTW